VNGEQNKDVKRESDNGSDLERILAKYVTIWVWSILVGINTTVTLSFVSGVRSRGPEVMLLIGPLFAVGVLATLAAWYFIVNYLRIFIVPNFFWTSSGDLEKDPRAWRSIRLIGSFLFYAITFRLLLVLLDVGLSSTFLG
jgi:hypothetical protein